MILVCTSCAMGRLAGMGLNMDATGRDRRENSEEATSPPGDTEGTGVPDVDSVAEIVGEVSESAERPSQGRPVTEVARSALARVVRGRERYPARGERRPPAAGRRQARNQQRRAPKEHFAAGKERRRPRYPPGRARRPGGYPLAGQRGARARPAPARAGPGHPADPVSRQVPGRLADALIEGASRASAAIGATVGVWSVLPVAPAFPAEVVTETLTLVGIEIKLIAELHEVYGARPPGDLSSRMTAYVGAWAHRRGVALTPGGVVLAMGSPLGRRLQRRLAFRAGRSALSLGPLLSGAAIGAMVNRRETRRLGHEIRDDLRKKSSSGVTWPQ